jgi:tRNA threonylcarbamoyladenosine biosynthesis protein TsaE
MYRIGSEDELYSTGFYDYTSRHGFILAEWSENIPYALPDRYIEVRIVKDNQAAPDSRRISINLAENKETA